MSYPDLNQGNVGGCKNPPTLPRRISFEAHEADFNEQVRNLELLGQEIVSLCHQNEITNSLLTQEGLFKGTGLEDMMSVVNGGVVSLEGLGRTIRVFLENVAKTINSIGTATSKLLLSGMPLYNGIIKKAIELKARAKHDEVREEDTVSFKGMDALAIGNTVPDVATLLQVIGFLDTINESVITSKKLSSFENISNSVLEPFRGAITRGRTDEIVFIIGVLAALTNPAVPVGMVFKQLFSALSPSMGAKIDTISSVAGLGFNANIVKGMAVILPTMGSVGASILRDFEKGRMSMNRMPRYRPVYPFIDKRVDGEKAGFLTEWISPTILGNYQWSLLEYAEDLHDDMRGSVNSPGAKFKKLKNKEFKAPDSLPCLNADQIVEIADFIRKSFEMARAYAKEFPAHYRSYNKQYTNISDIVMTNSGEQLRDSYVRYSYRNAMNIMLGSMWQNCFGSDNKYLRYLIGVSKALIKYCEASLTPPTSKSEDVDKA